MTDEAIRLAKRVAEQVQCSRAEAERYIAGGWVTVDGIVVEEPAMRVTPAQQVALLAGASAGEQAPVTILLHKPAGVSPEGEGALACLVPETLEQSGPATIRFLKRHLSRLTLATPLETRASGLVVFTQDFRVVRTLVENRNRIEHEYIVDVSGKMPDDGLALLNRGLTFEGRQLAPVKASWQSETRLRIAAKDIRPGQVERLCRALGLQPVEIRRIRIGRMPLSSLPAGHWRYLQGFERF
jgi:23S rRNA pseudouridine2604 synthase